MSFRAALGAAGVRPLIKHRVFAPYDHAHNARIDDELYHQRSTSESVNSSLKRSHGSAIRARDWFRQFREIALIAGVHDVERSIEADIDRNLRIRSNHGESGQGVTEPYILT